MTRILVLRDRSYAGMFSAMAIEVDGKKVAKVRRGGRVSFEVPDGAHAITVGTSWMKSHPVVVTTGEGDSLRLLCGCRGYGDTMHAWVRTAGYEYHHF